MRLLPPGQGTFGRAGTQDMVNNVCSRLNTALSSAVGARNTRDVDSATEAVDSAKEKDMDTKTTVAAIAAATKKAIEIFVNLVHPDLSHRWSASDLAKNLL